jgi:uncharacterized membrane protein
MWMNLETLRMYLNLPHVIIGGVILFTGALQLVLRKGGTRHALLGKIYTLCMVLSFLTSFPTAIAANNYFLATVGMFSLFMAVSAYRFLSMVKRPQPSVADKLLTLFFAFGLVWMTALMVQFAAAGHWTGVMVLGVFAWIYGWMSLPDFFCFVWKGTTAPRLSGQNVLRHHIGRMVGSYIAAVTAFLVNVQPLPFPVLNWLLPTALGTTLIPFFMKKYTPKREKK